MLKDRGTRTFLTFPNPPLPTTLLSWNPSVAAASSATVKRCAPSGGNSGSDALPSSLVDAPAHLLGAAERTRGSSGKRHVDQ